MLFGDYREDMPFCYEDPGVHEELNLLPRDNSGSLEGIQHLVNLEFLYFNNQVSDLSPLQNLVNLQHLSFSQNQASDISPLRNLVNLQVLVFWNNQVSDIQPLVHNTGLGSGDTVDMRWNSLDLTPDSQNMNDIHELIDRGVNVEYDPQN